VVQGVHPVEMRIDAVGMGNHHGTTRTAREHRAHGKYGYCKAKVFRQRLLLSARSFESQTYRRVPAHSVP
jgi:hypothetical protein